MLPKGPSHEPADLAALLVSRKAVLNPGLSLSYDESLVILRGAGSYLFDDTGRPYLDCVNNVCHVGHCHPRVVTALATQAAQLNTNSRYLHPGRLAYAQRLAGLFPDPLEVVQLVNSGSEATELALRMARAKSGAQHFLVLGGGYHGNSAGAMGVSPYKLTPRGAAGVRIGCTNCRAQIPMEACTGAPILLRPMRTRLNRPVSMWKPVAEGSRRFWPSP